MPIQEETIEQVNLATSKYKYGFSTDLEVDKAPKGLHENIIKLIFSPLPAGGILIPLYNIFLCIDLYILFSLEI